MINAAFVTPEDVREEKRRVGAPPALEHLQVSATEIQESDVVIYVERGTFHVIKNRYGREHVTLYGNGQYDAIYDFLCGLAARQNAGEAGVADDNG